MNFQPVDRLPRMEYAEWWDQTIARWSAEGLPVTERYAVCRHFGLDPYPELILFPRAESCPQPKQHGHAIVRNMDEYLQLKETGRLYPPVEQHVKRLQGWANEQNQGQAVVWFTIEGFFWFPRTLLGIEPHLYAFYDQPELMHAMNRDLVDYNIRIVRELSQTCTPTFMSIREDMSYNHGPMLSEPLFEEFLAPYYRELIPTLKELDIVVIIDSDGDIEPIIPWLQRVGADGLLPLEHQAGVDVPSLQKKFPTFRFVGNFDKMVMTRGETAIRREFERLLPAMRNGGFIPCMDHQTPPGVSMKQYQIYTGWLNEYTQRATEQYA